MTWSELWRWLQSHWRWDFGSVQFVLTGLLLVGATVWRFVKYFGASSWPVVNGTVEYARSAPIDNAVQAEITYSYEVNGEYYSGQFFKTFLRDRTADEYVARFKGKTVPVHYNPRQPDCSKLIEKEAERAVEGMIVAESHING